MPPTSAPRNAPVESHWSERFVSANGLRFHLAEAGPGDGPLVLLLHGFPECFLSWRYQIPALADRFHVVAPDLRGYNLTEKPADGYDIATLAADIRELIFALGCQQADVVGHDWGGLIAWAVGIREPEVVRRLVVVNALHPAAIFQVPRHPRQLLRSSYVLFFQLRGLAERALSRDDYAAIRRTFRHADPRRAWLSDEEIERYVEAIARPRALAAALEYYRQLPKAYSQLSPLRVITAPTLVLWGELDPYAGPEFVARMQPWVKNLRIQRFPTAGHWLNQEEPEQVSEALRAFLCEP